jgi:hypothetical protein
MPRDSRDKQREQGTETYMDLREGREGIASLGGENAFFNAIRGYLGNQGPRYIEGQYRSGAPRNQFVEGYTMKSSLPDDLEPGTYMDKTRGEIVKVYRTEPTRNRPKGRLVKEVIERDLDTKTGIHQALNKYGTGAKTGQLLAAGELATLPFAAPALVKAGAQGVKAFRKSDFNLNQTGAVGNIVDGTTVVRGKNVSDKNLNSAAQMGYGVNWNQLSKGQIDGLLDPRGIGPKINLETGKINSRWKPIQNNPKYNGTREVDIAYTKELDSAAAYHSGGAKKYSDYLTEAQRKNQDVGRNNPVTQSYIRKQFIKDNKFITPTKGKPSNLNAVREATEEKLVRRAGAFYEQHGRYPTETELHFNSFGYTVKDSRGTDLVDHSKVIRNLEKNNTLNLSTADEARIERKLEESEGFQKGIKDFENQYDEVADKVSDILNIDRKRVTDFFARGHSLRDAYFNRVPVELQEKLLRPNQLLTAGQNSRHIHYENTIIHLFDVKEEAMGYMNQILKGENTLNKTQLKSIDDLVETFGVSVKEGASKQQKVQAILKGINKNLDQVDNQMLEEGVFTPMYDPISNKERIFGQSTGSKFDPFDPKRPRSDQTRVPPDITSQVASPADKREAYRRLSEKMESIDPKTGLPTATNKYGLPLSKGGEVRKNMEPGGTTGISEKFTGLSFGFGNIRELQQDIKDLYDDKLSDTIEPIREATEIKVEDVLKDTRTVLNKGDRPIEVRPITEGYKLITDSPIIKSVAASAATGRILALETVESIYNNLRKGTENDIQMEEYFPAVYGLRQFLTESVGKTPDDQTYISFIDEVNRAQETGFTRLGYNIVDLASLAPDWAFGTDATGRIKKSYDKMIEEGRITEPETFLGEVGAIGVEFGVPGGAVFKGVNTLRRMIKATTGVNLFAVPTYSLTGGALLGTKISNVAKRVGTTAAVFGGTDFIAGGPYNTVSEVFKDDPLLFDNSLGYDYENTEGLSGKELSVANFKNRLRFAADGAIIGGLFPLVGPPLWAATKYGVLKPGAAVAGKTLQLGNELAVKPLTYLAGGTLKAPFTKPGKLEVEVPGLREVSQGLAGGTKIFASFLGKDVITRAAVAAMGAKPGLIKQLPDFKDWRMFEVNDSDPLKANLKKIDKVFEFFREAGAKSPDELYLDVKTQNFIKSKSRQIEKMLDSVERKAYDLANGFLKKYNTNKTSPAGQDYLLDQVLSYIKGQIKLSDLPQELQSMSKALSEEFDSVRNFYKDVLPDDSGLKQFLTSNLKSYIRQSFGVFTNPQFKVDPKLKEKAIDFVVDRIRNNESLVELAVKGSVENTDIAIRNFARQQVDDLLATVKTEGFDPIIQLQKIAKENLKLDDVYVQTGEELPDVIRKLLGEEQGLRSSVMQTTASLVTQAANLKNYNRIGELLLRQGRLFASRDEAVRAGVVNPVSVGRVPGLGLLDSGITQLYGSKEVTGMLRGSLGQLDKFMESSIYQGMIAYKAGVQTGKTVLSPATQTRNFGSAAAFVLNNGWIGGKASVSDAIKITLDDIFGAGRTFNEEELIKNITRKSELGVIDENIVASELSAVLADIKSGKIGTFGTIASAADNSKLMKTATRLYSGGDNVWKWYGHEYLKSQLKGGFKNINEVKKAVKDDFGITEFNPKNMYEAIEEYAGMLVRELMPTYSKVPPMIQAIRKIPFIGNFVSFPAEIIRTSFATSTLAMKHIASDNATLRAMGYRSLMGQAATLWALNEGARGLGYAMTNITPEQIRTYKDEFAADYMKYSDLIPISNLDKRKGTFKVFDMSRYNPYDLISSTVNNLIVRATDPKTKLDPDRIETDVLSEYFGASGPLLDLLNGTLFGLSIGTEGVYEALTGKTKTGSSVYSESDTALEKFDKAIMHIFNKNEPGVISSAQRVTAALAGDVSGTGQPIEIGDEAFKLIGGSTVTVDVPGSFAFKISEFQNTFKEPRVSEGWYSTKNYQQRGPEQLVREYNDMNEEAFREQYRFYQAVQSALSSKLMSRRQIEEALEDRKISKKVIDNILRGRFTPLSWGRGGLEARYQKIKKANPRIRVGERYFIPERQLDRAKDRWERQTFRAFEMQRKEPEQVSQAPIVPTQTQTAQPDLPVPPLPDTGTPEIAPNQMANVSGTAVSPQTGLTNSESVYLSPTEQLYRRKERGLA